MISSLSLFRTLSPRQEDLRQRLLAAVRQRQGELVARLSLQWVHRVGVEALDPLMASVADPEAAGWWRQCLLAGSVAPWAQASQGPLAGGLEAERSVPGGGCAEVPAFDRPAAEVAAVAQYERHEESPRPRADLPNPAFRLGAAPEAEALPLAAGVAPSGMPAVPEFAHSKALGAVAEENTGDGMAAVNVAEPLPLPLAEAALIEVVLLDGPAVCESSGATLSAGVTDLGAPVVVGTAEPPEPAAQASDVAGVAPSRLGRFARLRHLVRDCFEEVASTFQGQDEEGNAQRDDAFAPTPEPLPLDRPTTVAPGVAPRLADPLTSGQRPADPVLGATLNPFEAPWVAIEATVEHQPSALKQPALQLPAQQEPVQQQPLQQRSVQEPSAAAPEAPIGPVGAPATTTRLPYTLRPVKGENRPAPPAPAHPALDRLRAWLPDERLDDQRRAS
ncbi:hypothetical protein [Cyanobium sp. Morenito 9A2]|uniref:hypothetical protein n=1 Tax=Cyanobium sp. Morenito 9A2 TaxID=2823718 RepID=UPI0020CEA960|nr:hypothetical protein [Cyanobium sp. Morenito 9A2]MCP9848281.1 hypothetical protein [Cyanobium sp. Morenito 9A2]